MATSKKGWIYKFEKSKKSKRSISDRKGKKEDDRQCEKPWVHTQASPWKHRELARLLCE